VNELTEYLVQNDNKPDQEFVLTTEDGNAQNLTDTTVNFYFMNDNSREIVNDGHTEMTITNAAAGECTYVWDNHSPDDPVDLATPGGFTAEVEVTLSDGKIQTVYDTYKYHIRQELGPVAEE
jgi:hypothetical protein